MNLFYVFLLPIISGFTISAILTFFVIKLAKKLNILDIPRGRHQHEKPTPLLGGIAIGVSFLLCVLFLILTHKLPGGYINLKKIIGILISVVVLMIGGFLDDKFDLKPWQQILFQILAVIIVISSGIGINFITDPFNPGGCFRIDTLKFGFVVFGIPFVINVFADLFTFCWVIGTTYTTKVLDGIDGLVASISSIGFLIIGFLCLGSVVHQPDTAILSFLMAGSYLGFLLFNHHPAKIFLGESGSVISGFLLGVFAIIAGGKIAITLLVLSVPIIDFFIVIISRLLSGKSPFKGDRRHLHYRLKRAGFSDAQIVAIICCITLFFGVIGLIPNSILKLCAIIFAFLFMITSLFGVGLYKKLKKNN